MGLAPKQRGQLSTCKQDIRCFGACPTFTTVQPSWWWSARNGDRLRPGNALLLRLRLAIAISTANPCKHRSTRAVPHTTQTSRRVQIVYRNHDHQEDAKRTLVPRLLPGNAQFVRLRLNTYRRGVDLAFFSSL